MAQRVTTNLFLGDGGKHLYYTKPLSLTNRTSPVLVLCLVFTAVVFPEPI